ncbi:MAG: SAM-dependent methyltransferase [Bryobacteraceae bacterium]|nr:SAM-dependent methyltransferase [Bryobacteraceae bacterium]
MRSLSEAFAQAERWRYILEDFTPFSESLEWRLSERHWQCHGVSSFVDGTVPFTINNTGQLSIQAAALLFANCMEAVPSGPLQLLEVGAGTGLFARYLLDEFQRLCLEGGRDFYSRLLFHITDTSPRTVEQWRELDVFGPHGKQVCLAVAGAADPPRAGPFQAVFANYVLDLLPAAVLRRRGGIWQELHARTWIRRDSRLPTGLGLEHIRQRVRRGELDDLLPLIPVIETDEEYLNAEPVDPRQLLPDAPDTGPMLFNHGAFDSLDTLLGGLASSGFVLVNDYAGGPVEAGQRGSTAQRFGRTMAVGLDFALLDKYAQHAGVALVAPPGDSELPIHPRLLTRAKLGRTERTFTSLFSADAYRACEQPAVEAKRLIGQGLFREALDGYRRAIERNCYDWQRLTQAARLIAFSLGDPESALPFAQAAGERNAWYSPAVWNTLGQIHGALGQHEASLDCHRRALDVNPNDAETNLLLGRCWLKQGEAARCLECIARGLANDREQRWRHDFLDLQTEAMNALLKSWNAEYESAARRLRLC